MNKLASTLHDATHQVPGVPIHADMPATNQPHRTRVNHRRRNQTPKPRDHRLRHQTPPRVLVAWQNWIGRLVRGGNGQQR
jgi:hypothetical protein